MVSANLSLQGVRATSLQSEVTSVLTSSTACLLAVILVGCSFVHDRPNGDIAAVKPTPRLPAQNAVFNLYPRELRLAWDSIPGAVEYVVTVEALSSESPDHESRWIFLQRLSTAENHVITSFVGAQPGRWKVLAVDRAGNRSMESDWSAFGFLR
jgi:hypothetical protein